MGKNPLEIGNYVLILLGIVLTILGPYMLYKMYLDIRKNRKTKGAGKILGFTKWQWVSHGINLLIAALFLFAGVLFVINNLRGPQLV